MAERRPGRVPDHDPAARPSGLLADADGFDTDGDGHTDTVLTTDGVDLILLTDLDGDGHADQLLRFGPDGLTRETPVADPTGSPALRGLVTGMEAGY